MSSNSSSSYYSRLPKKRALSESSAESEEQDANVSGSGDPDESFKMPSKFPKMHGARSSAGPSERSERRESTTSNTSTASSATCGNKSSSAADSSSEDDVADPDPDPDVGSPATATATAAAPTLIANFYTAGAAGVFASNGSATETASAAAPPPSPPQRADLPGQYSSMAQKMMAKMGYQEGKGLGREGQGRVEPVGLSKQRGRRGLGLIIKGLEEETVEWDASTEHVEVEEKVNWLPTCTLPVPSMTELRGWMREGERKETIDDETRFADPEVLSAVLKCKTIFDRLEPKELMMARSKSNVFETIKGAFFQNRAAMKMANMDAVFDFMFTSPKVKDDGRPSLRPNELLYFADVCAGPGGFSEYVLWKKKWRSKGFGFTIRGKQDFKLDDFFAGSPESFDTHYGEGGMEGDGDVFKERNIRAFTKYVLDNTNGLGVHFMMADGGFGVEGNENIQEILSKQLYLCQFLVAMNIVRTGGHFVCKLFDLFTPFSVGLVYLMYRAFDKVTIHKPNTSRPANSERYIICKYKRDGVDNIRDYLLEINMRLNEIGLSLTGGTSSEVDVRHVVPEDIILDDEKFTEFMAESNNSLGERQVIALSKIAAFCKDPLLREDRQEEIKNQCLHFWQIPNEARKAPKHEPPTALISRLLGPNYSSLMSNEAAELNANSLTSKIKSIYDWKFVVLGQAEPKERTFFLGMGRKKVYKLNPSLRENTWSPLRNTDPNITFELPPGTLIYAEIVQEMRGEFRSMRRVAGFHVIDALFIGGEDVRHADFRHRNELVHLLVDAMNKRVKSDLIVMRAKAVHNLENLEHIVGQQKLRLLKSQMRKLQVTLDLDDPHDDLPRFFCPSGLLLYRMVPDPYVIAFSKSKRRKYWFNTANNSSSFECPRDAVVNFERAFCSRVTWSWKEGVKTHPEQDFPTDDGKVQADSFISHVRSALPN